MALLDGGADLGRVTVRPGRFNQQATRMAVAGLCDTTQPASLTGGMFGWRKTKPGSQLPRVIEARQITELDKHADRGCELNAPQRLKRLDCQIETPPGRHFAQGRLQPGALGKTVFDRPAMFLERELLPW
jgi:hypothetical protein